MGDEGAVGANCIFWGNDATTSGTDQVVSGSGTITCSDVEGGFTGTGNIDVDPVFSSGYHAGAEECMDSGDSSAIVTVHDAYDVNRNGNLVEPTPDLDLAARVTCAAVDMGASSRSAMPVSVPRTSPAWPVPGSRT